ncbi:hypothetical protein FCN13_06295 [Pseudomonas sp. UMC631]|nr:hypothetical protein [Pseudomonas sp. UMA643]NTY18158.1 hypothetical protein [Pseudomonas sp. UMC3103]NTY26902.1 hypothetical protein [Pseudomonas sp. UMA603]NTY30289.1 hypothetical protein [Pseudomonas sp. UMC3129]NTY53215.1 hypothetical protein [Pseudomonas sp. UMC631]NTY65958.1 hypothetical protein [Pseudomonas sp. UMC3106]NUA35746.1 hypothetical protein [Pseudomonas sp. UMA601]
MASISACETLAPLFRGRELAEGAAFLGPRLRSRELEQNKAKTGEEAQFRFLNEHYSPVFNAVMPTRSRS